MFVFQWVMLDEDQDLFIYGIKNMLFILNEASALTFFNLAQKLGEDGLHHYNFCCCVVQFGPQINTFLLSLNDSDAAVSDQTLSIQLSLCFISSL